MQLTMSAQGFALQLLPTGIGLALILSTDDLQGLIDRLFFTIDCLYKLASDMVQHCANVTCSLPFTQAA